VFDLAIELGRRPDALAVMGEALGQAGISVEGGGMCTVDGKAIAHFLVEDGHQARRALAAAGISVTAVREVLALDGAAADAEGAGDDVVLHAKRHEPKHLQAAAVRDRVRGFLGRRHRSALAAPGSSAFSELLEENREHVEQGRRVDQQRCRLAYSSHFAVETSLLPADPVCLGVSLPASGQRTSEASRSFSSTQMSRALLSSCPFSTPCRAQVGSE
jgi:hypothetical protein